jgi:hypothetical protein
MDEIELRNYFAALAMQAIISRHGVYDEDAYSESVKLGYDGDCVAEIAFSYADSMVRSATGLKVEV